MLKRLPFFAFLCAVLPLFAQTDMPTYGYNYQAIIRDAAGKSLLNQSIQLRFQILNTANAKLYEETHLVVTDAFGRATSVVGSGTALFGKFDTLNWAGRKHFPGGAVKLGSAANWVDLGKEQVIHQRAETAFCNICSYWPSGIVPYEFDANVSSSNRIAMENAMKRIVGIISWSSQQHAHHEKIHFFVTAPRRCPALLTLTRF